MPKKSAECQRQYVTRYFMTKVRIPPIEFGTGTEAMQEIKTPSDDNWSLCRELIAGDYLVCVWAKQELADV